MLGKDPLLPGSDFLIAGLARFGLLIGVLGLIVIGIYRLVRRPRRSTRRDGHQVRRWTGPLVGFASLSALAFVATLLSWPPKFHPPQFAPLPEKLLPADSIYYRPVDDLPVADSSDAAIKALRSMPFSAPFGGNPYLGNVAGLPFNLVDNSTRRLDIRITQYPEASFLGQYPIVERPLIEGLPNFGNDQHYLAIDTKERRAWELISFRRWFWLWEAGSGATWTMDNNDYPNGSTIASQLPVLPGVVRYEEAASGSIDHMILAVSAISRRGAKVWPAKGTDGISDDPNSPPMGAWMRLKADVDLSGLGPQALAVAKAMQRYGVVISDTGPDFKLRGTADRRWDVGDLRTLDKLSTDDFEVLDASSLMVSPDSLAAIQPAG